MAVPRYTNQSVADNEKKRRLGITFAPPVSRYATDQPFSDQASGGDPLAEAQDFLARTQRYGPARDIPTRSPEEDLAALQRQPDLPMSPIRAMHGMSGTDQAKLATDALSQGPALLAERSGIPGAGTLADLYSYVNPALRATHVLAGLRQAAFPAEDESRLGGALEAATAGLPLDRWIGKGVKAAKNAAGFGERAIPGRGYSPSTLGAPRRIMPAPAAPPAEAFEPTATKLATPPIKVQPAGVGPTPTKRRLSSMDVLRLLRDQPQSPIDALMASESFRSLSPTAAVPKPPRVVPRGPRPSRARKVQ